MWVDRAECKIFVENIQTAFHTKRPKSTTKDHLRSEQSPSASKLKLYPCVCDPVSKYKFHVEDF